MLQNLIFNYYPVRLDGMHHTYKNVPENFFKKTLKNVKKWQKRLKTLIKNVSRILFYFLPKT